MIKQISIALAVGLLLGSGAVYRFYPRTQTVEKEVVRTDIKTVTVVIRPDGTREEITTVDRSTRVEDKKSTVNQPQWLVTGGAGISNSGTAYSLGVSKRLLGPMFIGVQGVGNASSQTVLGTISVEF